MNHSNLIPVANAIKLFVGASVPSQLDTSWPSEVFARKAGTCPNLFSKVM